MTVEHLLLAEQLLLLAIDPTSGKPPGSVSVQLPAAIGGALLLDLALRQRLRIEVDVPRVSTRPSGDELLDEVARQLREGSPRRTLRRWVRRVGTSARREQVRDRLVAQGALLPEQRPVLGALTSTRYRLADPVGVQRRGEQVAAVLTGARRADAPTTALASLVGASAVLDQLLPPPERRAARRRARQLVDTAHLSAAARAVIRDTQAALVTSVGTSAGAAARVSVGR